MQRYLVSLFILVCLNCLHAQEINFSRQNEHLLKQLDEVVANKDIYQNRRLSQADSLRALARNLSGEERIKMYKDAYETYSRFVTDSVFVLFDEIRRTPEHASDQKFQIWTNICEARNYGMMGLYTSSFDILHKYQPEDLDPEMKLLYYNTLRAVTGWMADFSKIPAKNLSVNLADSAFSYLQTIYTLDKYPISSILIHSTLLLEQKQYQQCIDTLLQSTDMFDEGSIVYQYAILAQAYEETGQEDEAIYYLTQTSIHDLKEGVTEYMALPVLAKLIQEKGQTERAYNYLICSLEDASLCHSSLRTLETANFFPIIDGARRAEDERLKQTRQFATVLGILCVLSVIIILALRIRNAHKEVKQKKKHLEEISVIAEHDELTGLLNRHGSNLYIVKAIEKQQPGYLGILDIDLFKMVNDTYGHNVGDKALKAVAKCLETIPHQITARIGGDEFISYTTDQITAEEYAKNIETFFDAIRAIRIPEMGDNRISVSFGAAYYDGTSHIGFDELYREADSKLYESKKAKGCKMTL